MCVVAGEPNQTRASGSGQRRSIDRIGARRTAVEERDLARLLVRDGERLLEAAVPVPELVAPPLLGLDALLTDGLAAAIGGLSDMYSIQSMMICNSRVVAGASSSSRLEFLVFILAFVVASAGSSLMPERGSARGRGGHGVEAMRARDGGERTSRYGGRGDGAASAAAAVGCNTVRAELSSTQVRQSARVDRARRGVRAPGRG